MSRTATACLALLLAAAPALAGVGPAETVLLVNSGSPDSRRVAAHFAKLRNIPARQVCEVKCAPALETSMDDFVRDVVEPLRRFLRERGLEDRVTTLVMTQGMPILARTPTGAVSTAAALSYADTEICGQPSAGPVVPNPYKAGPAPLAPLGGSGRFLLVTALLSTTADEAIALVDRSVASDGTAPAKARFVFQDADGAAGVRNGDYDTARRLLDARGFETEHVPQNSAAAAVRGREALMGYMSGGSYSHLTVDGVDSNRYLPGALCDMLQSYGAVPANFVPDAKNQQQFPVTHMVRAGVTGVHGAVSEPYNIAFPGADLFQPYVEGFTLAETFHQKLPLSYWMNLTLGDPLCAPYAKRPRPAVGTTDDGKGRVTFDVSASGAVKIDVYVDGRAAGSVKGAIGSVSIDTANWPGDAHEVLVEATGPGAAEPRGWEVVGVAWKGPKTEVAPAPVGRTPFDRLVLTAPSTIAAGETFTVKSVVGAADGSPLAAWSGRLEMRSASPPVRWARVDATTPSAEMSCRLVKAGDYELTVTAPDDGRDAKLSLHVGPGAFDHATCPASSYPLGQECDLDVVLEDRFGNRVAAYTGTIELSVPADPAASVPPPLSMTTGHGVLSNVLLTRGGDAQLVLRAADGRVVSARGEHVNVQKAAIRPWLIAGPGASKALFAGDPASSATGDGSLAAKLSLRRRVGGDVVQLPAGVAKTGDAAVLVAWIEALGATNARLLGAAPGRTRVLVDGKEVFEGVPKATDAKGRREPLADIAFSAGTHRLTVVTETTGPTSVSFELDDGKGQFPGSLRIRARASATDAPK